VDHATHAFGLAVPSGIVSSTGVAGGAGGGGGGGVSRRGGGAPRKLVGGGVGGGGGGGRVGGRGGASALFLCVRRGGGGGAGRGRQLRRGDVVSLPGPRGQHGLRRSHAVGVGRRGGCNEVVSRVHHPGARRDERILRHHGGAPRPAVPGSAAPAQDVRNRL